MASERAQTPIWRRSLHRAVCFNSPELKYQQLTSKVGKRVNNPNPMNWPHLAALPIIALVLALYAAVLSTFTALRIPVVSFVPAPPANQKIFAVLSVSNVLTQEAVAKLRHDLEEQFARGGSIILGPGMKLEWHHV
jgi:hypothetical protein